MVVLVGLAVTEVPVVALSPVAGDHVYVSAPVAVSVVEDPMQIEALGEAVTPTVGRALTVTVIVAVLWHPVAVTVPVTV